MTDTVFDWMAAANKRAKGKRPDFFNDPQDERLLSILMAVIGEVSVLRERMDTVERLLESKGTVTRKDIATLKDVLAADGATREAAHEWLACLA